jgi:hypothetical protein
MKSIESKKIIRELSSKYKVTIEQVENIIRSPFLLQIKVMREKCNKEKLIFPTVKIPGWGMFYFPNSCRKTREEKLRKQNEVIRTK